MLGLTVLLAWPCLGLSGRAEASFALAPSKLTEDRLLAAEFQHRLNSDKTDEHEEHGATGGRLIDEERPFAPPCPTAPPRFRDLFPAYSGSQSQGASSTGGSPPGSGAGVGMPFILTFEALLAGAERGGRLFLADERFKPPPFTSRWFRPPREGSCPKDCPG